MRARGLVTTRRDGTSIWYSVAEPQLFEMLDAARAIFDNQLAAQSKLAADADSASPGAHG
ncbi:MAG: hypothetical protein ABI782_04130 [Anaerolineaceae bacterium]